jgi:hypothetical protein
MAEPMTTLTDYAIVLKCLLFADLLLGQSWVERLWMAVFSPELVAESLISPCLIPAKLAQILLLKLRLFCRSALFSFTRSPLTSSPPIPDP